mgnify:CR=1 FL=1
MTGINWMMQEIIILLLAGHMPGERKGYSSLRRKGGYLLHALALAIYRKKVFEKIGYFDEEHFAYLEDIDVGYRARIFGYETGMCQLHWSIM